MNVCMSSSANLECVKYNMSSKLKPAILTLEKKKKTVYYIIYIYICAYYNIVSVYSA